MTPNGLLHRIPRLVHHYDQRQDVAAPFFVDWSTKAKAALAQMYLNDQFGDCVIAGQEHAVGIWSGNETGTPIIASNEETERNYVNICGPGDNGCVITDVLHAMKHKRFVMAGAKAKLAGSVAIDWTNKNEVMVALEVFGAMTVGVNFDRRLPRLRPWHVVWNFKGKIIGGHDVTIYGDNSEGLLVSTWGSIGTVIPWGASRRSMQATMVASRKPISACLPIGTTQCRTCSQRHQLDYAGEGLWNLVSTDATVTRCRVTLNQPRRPTGVIPP